MALTLPIDLERQLESTVASGMFSTMDEAMRVVVERFMNEVASRQMFPPDVLNKLLAEVPSKDAEEEWVDGPTFFKEMREHSRRMREKYGDRLPPQSSR